MLHPTAPHPPAADPDVDAPPPLSCRLAVGTHLSRLAVSGELDIGTVSQFRSALDRVAHDAPLVLVDLSAVTFIDLCSLRALTEASQALEVAGARLLVSGMSGAVTRLFELTRAEEVLTVRDRPQRRGGAG